MVCTIEASGGGQEMNQNNCKYCNTKAISDTQSGSAKSEAVENNSAKHKERPKKGQQDGRRLVGGFGAKWQLQEAPK